MKDLSVQILFILFCIHKCVLTIQAARRRKSRPFSAIPLLKRYAATINMIAFEAGLALLTAVTSGIPVFGSLRIDGESLLLGLAFLILDLCLDPIGWKLTPSENRKSIAAFLPRTARERFSWLFICIAFGVGEEIIYRAVLFGIFSRLTGEYWMAAVASGVLFAFAHYWQGWPAVASTFFTAICLQWLVKISEGLYVAIGLHFLHNFINGILWGILIKPENGSAEGDNSSPMGTNAAGVKAQG